MRCEPQGWQTCSPVWIAWRRSSTRANFQPTHPPRVRCRDIRSGLKERLEGRPGAETSQNVRLWLTFSTAMRQSNLCHDVFACVKMYLDSSEINNQNYRPTNNQNYRPTPRFAASADKRGGERKWLVAARPRLVVCVCIARIEKGCALLLHSGLARCCRVKSDTIVFIRSTTSSNNILKFNPRLVFVPAPSEMAVGCCPSHVRLAKLRLRVAAEGQRRHRLTRLRHTHFKISRAFQGFQPISWSISQRR